MFGICDWRHPIGGISTTRQGYMNGTCRAVRSRTLFVQESNQNFQRVRILQYFEQSGVH
jgi:hypothetical protein